METKTVWLVMLRKVVPAEFEQWMEQMALQGWNVDKLGQFSSLRMRFVKTEPRQYRYVFDMNAFPNQEYRSTYEQFGWESVGQMASCFVWRKAYTDERPESFTDRESLVKRNLRVRNAVALCLALFLLGIAGSLVGIGVSLHAGKTEKLIELLAETAFMLLIAAYLWWVIRQIHQHREP